MYVLTNDKNMIVEISETLDYQSNGNPLVHHDTLAIAKDLVKNIYESVEVPEKVCSSKYCYTKRKGFYENEDYVEFISDEEKIAKLEQELTDTQKAITEIYELMEV